MPHGHKAESKHNRQSARDFMKLEAAKGQAALATVIPGAQVKIGLVTINGEDRRGFLISVPTSLDILTVEAGLDDARDQSMAKVRPWLAGKPRKVSVLERH